MLERVILVVLAVLSASEAFIQLKEQAYYQIQDQDGGYSINASTVNRLAFDPFYNIIYVTSKEPRRLLAFSLAPDGIPTLLTEVKFEDTGDVLDVAFCRGNIVPDSLVAVSVDDPYSSSADGEVRLYRGLTPVETDLTFVKTLTVKPEPVDVKFSEDCHVVLVAHRGSPTVEDGTVRDPDGTVTKVTLPHHVASGIIMSTDISFDNLFSPGHEEYYEMLLESNFRSYPRRDHENNLVPVPQNLEPEQVLFADDRTAYVTLPRNNAIARINLDTNMVATIIALGNRSWTDFYMDASDMDNKVDMRGYNIYSLMQPVAMDWVMKDGQRWMVTLDTGRLTDNPHTGYSDFRPAKQLIESNAIVTANSELDSQLRDDAELGRLLVSVEDGRRPSDGVIENVFAFGGRGFSLLEGDMLERKTGVVDHVERVTKHYYRSLFNTGYMGDPSSDPLQDVEATSPSLGPNLGALAVGEFDGKTMLVIGSATSGILYVYQLEADVLCPQPTFHSVHRSGVGNGTSWGDAYNMGAMGDIGITDIMYLKSETLAPIVVVASATSNSVSVYTLEDASFGVEDA